MNDLTPILAVTCCLLAVALVGALWSRHRLSVRHRSAKAALWRVAGERNDARWALAQAERERVDG